MRGPTTAEPFAPEAALEAACMECDPKSNDHHGVVHALQFKRASLSARQREERRHRPRHGIHDQPLILVLEDAEMAGARRRGGALRAFDFPAAEIVGSKCSPLLVRRDFPRRHAELIDIPIADDHLDRGQHCLTSLGVALPLGSQALKPQPRMLRSAS